MFNKRFYITIITIISILILSISCGNTMTDATNGGNGENNGGEISGGGSNNGGQANSGGDQTTTKTYIFLTPESILSLPENSPQRIEFHKTNWMNTFANQIIYKADGVTRQGFTDENGNYYDDSDPKNIRSKFMHGTNFQHNGKNYSVGVHKDQKNSLPFVGSWKIILVDETGGEYMFNGKSGNDYNSVDIPKDDTFASTYPVGKIGSIKIN